jgi:hypothetical protein
MVTRVEVTLENDTPQDRNRGFRCASVVTFDENEERTEHPDLINHKEYASRHLLVQEISRKLGVEDEIIEVISEDTLKDDADTLEEELYKNGSPYPYEMPKELDIREDKFSIYEWLRKLKKGQVLLNPEFQRHLVFKIFDYKKDYKGDMDEFLGETMKAINQMSDEEINALEKDFERVMKLTYEFFGPRNFRLPTEKSKGRINIAIMESISHFFSIQPDHFLQKHKEKIKENFDKLFADSDFIESVTRSTGDRGKVTRRFELAHKILGDV